MHQLAEPLAQLTKRRSRGALERDVLELLERVAPGAVIELFHCVGAPDGLRLLLAARINVGAPRTADNNLAESVPATGVGLDALPPISSMSLFERALRRREPVIDATSGRHIFPACTDAGGFAIFDLRRAEPISAGDLRLIQSLVDIYRNQVSLLDYGETDSLTGLLNRKTFDSTFHEAATLVAAEAQVSSLASERRAAAHRCWIGVIDIDHFKRVNDVHGHLIGDELLLMVAQLMRASFRFGDSLFRFGGEEFVVVLRAPERVHALRAFERFRERLLAHEFPRVGRVTASVGFSGIRGDDLPSDAFERADRAVYFAKQNGRNQVRCFEDLLEAGSLDAADRAGAVELF